MNKLSDSVKDMWLQSRLVPLNVEPTEWLINQLLDRVDQILANSYGGPLPQCEEALEIARLRVKEWAYGG